MHRILLLSALVVTPVWWVVCVALYLAALLGYLEVERGGFVPEFFITVGVGCLAGWALKLNEGTDVTPRPYVVALCLAGFLCGMVQTATNWEMMFGSLSDGVASGELGDRYLNNHGKRTRDLTEEEYQWMEAAGQRWRCAFFVMFSSICLGMTLHAWRVRGTPPAASESARPLSAAP